MVDLFERTIPEPNSGCWIWMGCIQNKGYGIIGVKRVAYLAHRVSYAFAHGPIPAGKCILHRCDNPICINPDHLFPGTQKENMRDMGDKGRAVVPFNKGEAHPLSRLTERDVLAIRNDGRSHSAVAAQYCVSKTTVSEIRARKSWGHIP